MERFVAMAEAARSSNTSQASETATPTPAAAAEAGGGDPKPGTEEEGPNSTQPRRASNPDFDNIRSRLAQSTFRARPPPKAQHPFSARDGQSSSTAGVNGAADDGDKASTLIATVPSKTVKQWHGWNPVEFTVPCSEGGDGLKATQQQQLFDIRRSSVPAHLSTR